MGIVKVLAVTTVKVPGKAKRRGNMLIKTSAYKKAIVKLAAGQTIPVFEGM